MKITKNITFLIGLTALLTALSGCGTINQLRAKDWINEGVRDYNKGKYEEAQAKFERALQLSPKMKNAQLFYARSVHARFETDLTEVLGLKTIKAYDDIVATSKDDATEIDKALAFKADVYKKLADSVPEKGAEYREKQRQLLLERANLPQSNIDTKADVFYTVGQAFWQESYRLNAPYVTHQQPVPPDVAEKMKPYIANGHEFLQKALTIKPEYADAYAYEHMLLLEEIKITSDPAKKKQLEAQDVKAKDLYMKYKNLKTEETSVGVNQPK